MSDHDCATCWASWPGSLAMARGKIGAEATFCKNIDDEKSNDNYDDDDVNDDDDDDTKKIAPEATLYHDDDEKSNDNHDEDDFNDNDGT